MRLFTTPNEPHDLETALGRKCLKADMLSALEYPDVYGLRKRAVKGSKQYEITVTIKAVKIKKARSVK